MSNPYCSVLLVEDNLGDARLIRRVLEGSVVPSYAVEHVETLAEAVRRLGTTRYDLVLLDLNLPDSQGTATVDRIIAVAPKHVTVMVLSGEGDVIGMKTLAHKATLYHPKGTDSASLLRAVTTAILLKTTDMDPPGSPRLTDRDMLLWAQERASALIAGIQQHLDATKPPEARG